ncbi:NADH dehydrogenase [Modicisalibacter ilicicola DSM 19980]|uniref:NADH dehydrogenase n=1 Tax=Modicisalibacter ilicicola DSM 19980 TaxID=1121942 RepID=A0A1M4TLU0_9GAMM|nr:complex I NDUFA9 subunit family protein [Halomonas ilicicola]SHE45462.1 NADH dehydrogenase [Halomonas ilicicola DSM 19980]
MARFGVTVFGGTGFLGRAIVRRLTSNGLAVRVAARHPDAAGFPETASAIEVMPVDVRDEAQVARALEGVDAAINVVSLYVERRDVSFDTIHVGAAERIARLAAQANVKRLVHVSGIGVSTDSSSSYVRARARGEQAVRRAFPEATILRPSVLFGPRGAFLGSLEAVTRLPVIPLFGTGKTRLQPVHVEDVAAAVKRALETSSARGRVFELGGAGAYRYRDILRAVLKSNGRHRPLLPVPFAVWKLLAVLLSLLPNPPLTRDQIILMQEDNVVSDGANTFKDFGIEPCSLATMLPPLVDTSCR